MDTTAGSFSIARASACSRRLCAEFSKLAPVGSPDPVRLDPSLLAAAAIAYREGSADIESKIVSRATLDNIDRAVAARHAAGGGAECPGDEFLALLLGSVAGGQAPDEPKAAAPAAGKAARLVGHAAVAKAVRHASDKTPLPSLLVPDDLVPLDLDGSRLPDRVIDHVCDLDWYESMDESSVASLSILFVSRRDLAGIAGRFGAMAPGAASAFGKIDVSRAVDFAKGFCSISKRLHMYSPARGFYYGD